MKSKYYIYYPLIVIVIAVLINLFIPELSDTVILFTFIVFTSLGTSAMLFISFQRTIKSKWSGDFEKIALRISVLWILSLIFILYFLIKILIGADEIILPYLNDISKNNIYNSFYFNPVVLIIRFSIYYIIWYIAYRKLKINRGSEALFLILIFFTQSLFATDIFSISSSILKNNAWFSSIFGVYFIINGISGAMALMILLYIIRKNKSIVTDQNIGKYFFAVNMLWAYVSLSQYLIIWYGNKPAETLFYDIRLSGGWSFIYLLVIILHFIIPFFLLLSKKLKRKKEILFIVSLSVLIAYVFEMYWIVYPPFFIPFWNIFQQIILFVFFAIFAFIFFIRTEANN